MFKIFKEHFFAFCSSSIVIQGKNNKRKKITIAFKSNWNESIKIRRFKKKKQGRCEYVLKGNGKRFQIFHKQENKREFKELKTEEGKRQKKKHYIQNNQRTGTDGSRHSGSKTRHLRAQLSVRSETGKQNKKWVVPFCNSLR